MRYAFIALLLAACAATPNEVRLENRPLGPVSTKVAPEPIAQCIARSWEAQDGTLVGQVVTLARGAGYEVRIRQGDYGVIALYEVTPNDSGANVRMWPRDNFVFNTSRQELSQRVARCAR